MSSQPLPSHGGPDDDTPMIRAGRATLAGCVAAIVFGTAQAAQVYLSMFDHGHAFLRILAWHVIGWLFWALAAFPVVQAGTRLSRPIARTNHVRRAALLAAVLIAVHVLMTAQLTVWLKPFTPIPGPTFEQALVGQLPSIILVDCLMFGLLLVGGNAYGAHKRARALERREARLEVELARAQLDALRLEIRPHFLFNTLHSIAALIRVKDNSRALEMLLGLSELMRAAVDGPRDHLVPLSTEIDFVKRYGDLQRARFADRLQIDWDVEVPALAVPVPTLFLQPLVENAIRHGASRQTSGCRIAIAARLVNQRLHLSVTDDGAGLPAGFSLERDAGTGLRNTSSRLQQMYGSRASLALFRDTAGRTVAEVVVPSSPVSVPVRTIA